MWRRIPDWLIYLIIVGLFYANAAIQSESIDAPIPPAEIGDLLPTQSPRDPSIYVKLDKPTSGMGTAFAINQKGQWLTARHVVDGCDDIGLRLGNRQIIRANSQLSKQTDVALLTAKWQRQPLTPDFNSQRRIGEYGYFFGFPQGKPGEVIGKLLGRHRLRVTGRYQTNEPILAWTEIGRTRGLRGSLGGISGGPVLDSDGEVIGIIAAESPRRGRVYSVAPRNLNSYVDGVEYRAATPIANRTYGLQADRYRRDRRIVQVLCYVK